MFLVVLSVLSLKVYSDVVLCLCPGRERKMEQDVTTEHPIARGNREPSGAYSVYVLVLLTVTYLLNQLDRFMLSVVTRPMAQDIHYGDLGCVPNSSYHTKVMDHTTCNATDKLL